MLDCFSVKEKYGISFPQHPSISISQCLYFFFFEILCLFSVIPRRKTRSYLRQNPLKHLSIKRELTALSPLISQIKSESVKLSNSIWRKIVLNNYTTGIVHLSRIKYNLCIILIPKTPPYTTLKSTSLF